MGLLCRRPLALSWLSRPWSLPWSHAPFSPHGAYQGPTAEQDHEDNEGLEPVVFDNLEAGPAQRPPLLPAALGHVHVEERAALHAGCGQRGQGGFIGLLSLSQPPPHCSPEPAPPPNAAPSSSTGGGGGGGGLAILPTSPLHPLSTAARDGRTDEDIWQMGLGHQLASPFSLCLCFAQPKPFG